MKKIMTVVSILTISSGCSSIRSITAPDDQNLLSGSGSIIQSGKQADHEDNDGNQQTIEQFEMINLSDLLAQYDLNTPKTLTSEKITSATYQYRRNDLQAHIISASNQRCAAYIRMLTTSKSQTQTLWTTLSLLMSGAASVISPASTAQAFAAGSTVSTGILSTYNEAYFNNLAINVISAGISKKRNSLLVNINQYQSRPLSEYSVNAAISDAIEYHAACNIITGMETAAAATQRANSADIAESLRTLNISPGSQDTK